MFLIFKFEHVLIKTVRCVPNTKEPRSWSSQNCNQEAFKLEGRTLKYGSIVNVAKFMYKMSKEMFKE